MTDIRHLLERQADWQKTRSRLPWPEKIRMAEAMRESLRQFRRAPSGKTGKPSMGPRSKPDPQGAASSA